MPGRMCLYRTQPLEGIDDPYCVECWETYTESVGYPNGNFDCKLSQWYADRQECFDENVLTEEEYAHRRLSMPSETEKQYNANLRVSLIVDGEEVAKKEQQNRIVTAPEKVVATTLANEPGHSPRYIDMVTGEEVWLDGFKVLRQDRGKLYSASLTVGVRQEYRKNKPTKRRGGQWGGLAVFDSSLAAFRFMANSRALGIWSCRWLPAHDTAHLSMPERFYRWARSGSISIRDGAGKIQMRNCHLPAGTCLANEVIILERV